MAAKAIMIQGTMSNAGKSLFAAALCRIFTEDGYNVAPFKSQNMALNSFITKDGFEMGRAQVVQAEAAKKAPDVRMNPILLKPTTDVGSQVIVNGKAIGNMKAAEYFTVKKQLMSKVLEAYNSLAAENDIIVIEGAGSPAEINLKDDDIVNMGMAKAVDAPVLLIGDIDRGGVFAQLYGTIALLDDSERERIKGLVINKFRGDANILKPGLDMFEERISDIGKFPFMGVVPYLYVDIDDEDSLSERLVNKSTQKLIDIAVIKLPKLSNFTDLNPFERYENVSLRYVSHAHEIKNADMIIIPGTKSSISDLYWLRQNGIEAEIKKAVNAGAVVFGVCGGFQILGKTIADPNGIEGGGTVTGMELLDIDTIFETEKTTTQATGDISKLTGTLQKLNALPYKGYEIHMGVSGEHGAVVNKGEVYGTYIHGIFDESNIVPTIIECLCCKKGVDIGKVETFDVDAYKEEQYTKLAQQVRNSLDMKSIYDILDL